MPSCRKDFNRSRSHWRFRVDLEIQSTVLLVVGLTVGRLLRRSGPAVQSGIYRTTLAAVLCCPIAAMVLAGTGSTAWSFESRRRRCPAESSAQPAYAAVDPPAFPSRGAGAFRPEQGADDRPCEPGTTAGAETDPGGFVGPVSSTGHAHV